MAAVRGIRGAVRAEENTREAILEATRSLLEKIAEANRLEAEDIVSILLTATVDLNADFPAYAVRELGWTRVPVLCAQEIEVPNSMTRLVRVLLHVNTSKSQGEIKHQYLGETRSLRPDLSGGEEQ
jgi:chorismate mutase